MSEDIAVDSMEYDVVIVGGGPSGLSTAIKLKPVSYTHLTLPTIAEV